MPNQLTKNLFSNNLALLGLVFLFLSFFLFCGYSYHGSECGSIFFLTNAELLSTKENLIIYSILLSFILAGLVATWRKTWNFRLIKLFFFSLLTRLRFLDWAVKIYYPMMEAFQRGIIHPKLYNFQIISN